MHLNAPCKESQFTLRRFPRSEIVHSNPLLSLGGLGEVPKVIDARHGTQTSMAIGLESRLGKCCVSAFRSFRAWNDQQVLLSMRI